MTVTRPNEPKGKLDHVEHRFDPKKGLWIRKEQILDRENRRWARHRFEYTKADITEVYRAQKP